MNDEKFTNINPTEKLRDLVDTAEDGAEVVKTSVLHTITRGMAIIARGLSATAVLGAALRNFDRGDALGWFGLSRRRSPFLTMAAFGAGAAVGGGLGLLFAPMPGSELRSWLYHQVKPTERKPGADDALEQTASTKSVSDLPNVSGDATPSNGGL